jgi:arginine exporter protein ArgO
MLPLLIALGAGLLIGFVMAMPVGPVGLIVFRRSIFKSTFLAITTGIGAALTDGFLAAVGAFGIKIIWEFIVAEQLALRLIGGTVILLTGLYSIFTKYKPTEAKKDSAVTITQHFLSGIILTGTNPLAALSFFVIFGSLGHRLHIGSGQNIALFLVIGVVLGSFLWWLCLTFIGKHLGHRVKPEHIDLINKCFGVIITLIGAAMIIGAFLK